MAFFNRSVPDFNAGDFVRGLTMPFRGLSYLKAHWRLLKYAVLPLLVNLLLYAAALSVFFYFWWNWQISLVDWTFWGPVGGWLAAAVNWLGSLFKLVVAILALGAAFFTFTAVGMVIASPLNDILSEKVEVVYCGSETRLSLPFRFTVRAGVLSFYDSMRNLLRQLIYTLFSLPFLFVPVVGFVPLFVVGAYFAGFGFLDAAMARNFLRPPHKRLIAGKRYWELIGFGIAMQTLFAVPGLGMILMPVGVVSGTLIYCGEDWEALLAGAGMAPPEGFVPPKCAQVGTGNGVPSQVGAGGGHEAS